MKPIWTKSEPKPNTEFRLRLLELEPQKCNFGTTFQRRCIEEQFAPNKYIKVVTEGE